MRERETLRIKRNFGIELVVAVKINKKLDFYVNRNIAVGGNGSVSIACGGFY